METGWGAAMGYPAFRLDAAGDEVPGFVFSSNELADHWEMCHDFEGHEYRRVVAEVTLDDGDTVSAHLYVISGSAFEK